MKLKQRQLEEQEQQHEQYVWKAEREQEVERMVRKKLEIEKVKEQQALVDNLLRKRQVEVGSIGEALTRKDVDSSEMLQRALRRAEVLQREMGAVDVRTQGLLVECLLEHNQENEAIRQQILEEVKAKMSRDKEEQQYKNEELLQQLNMQRMRFLDAEKVIRDKKAVHQDIMRRGIDFLAEIELGNAPPLEYVVKNIYQNRVNAG